MIHYLITFLLSLLPLSELRGGILYAQALHLPYGWLVALIGNALPLPFIYFFARKVLIWGKELPYFSGFFRFCIRKGEQAGLTLKKKAGRWGLFLALVLFVGIPLPMTGAFTGTLAASFLDLGFRFTCAAVFLGLLLATLLMTLFSTSLYGLAGF